MKRSTKPKDFLPQPQYPGGATALSAFVDENLVYPEAAREAGVSGHMTVRYTINYKGKVVKVECLSHLGYGCEEEAERVVKLLRFKVPPTRNLKVLYHRKLTIHFRMQQVEEKATTPVVQYLYTVVPAVKTKKERKDREGGTYSYNISL